MTRECHICRQAARNRADRKARRRRAIPYGTPSAFFELKREQAREIAKACAGPAVRGAVRHFKPWRVWLRNTYAALRMLIGLDNA